MVAWSDSSLWDREIHESRPAVCTVTQKLWEQVARTHTYGVRSLDQLALSISRAKQAIYSPLYGCCLSQSCLLLPPSHDVPIYALPTTACCSFRGHRLRLSIHRHFLIFLSSPHAGLSSLSVSWSRHLLLHFRQLMKTYWFDTDSSDILLGCSNRMCLCDFAVLIWRFEMSIFIIIINRNKTEEIVFRRPKIRHFLTLHPYLASLK